MMRQGGLQFTLAAAAAALLVAGLVGCGGSADYEAEAEAETVAEATSGAGSEAADGTSAVPRATGGTTAASRADGLVGHWKLDETSGTTAADSAGKGEGALRYIAADKWTTGKVGGALQFDGAGYVRVRDQDSLDLRTAVTVAAWIYLTDATGDQNVVQKSDNYALWEIREGGTPQNVIDVRGDQEWETFKYTKAASWFLNSWHHVAFTYDGTKAVNYIDGAQDGAAHPQTGDMTTNFDWLGIGTNGAWADAFFKGKIDDARVYNKALTAAEVKGIYQETGR